MSSENLSGKVQNSTVVFVEVRRMSTPVKIGKYRIARNFDETLKLYDALQDKSFKRSAPIPSLEPGEYLLAIQPAMMHFPFGDLEIVKIVSAKKGLRVEYREVASPMNEEAKLRNPLVILKIAGEVPATIDLIKINN